MGIERTIKQHKIFNWLGRYEQYKGGVTNKQVIDHFGKDYSEAWKLLKKRKNHLFFENGRWYRWEA